MSENLNNSENDLATKNQYLYGGFQRVSSYDPNMCTTAARLSPFYGKGSTQKTIANTDATFKSLIYVQSTNETGSIVDPSTSLIKCPPNSVGPTYLSFNNELLTDQQTSSSAVYVDHPVTFNDKEQDASVLCDGVGIDYIQQIDQGIDEATGEPITTGIVLHRSPNGHLYQNFYVNNEDGTPGEVVELVPIDPSDANHLQEMEEDAYTMQPYEFPPDCNMETFEHHHMSAEEGEETRRQIMEAQTLAREQQRILLERTMSPLLAAVNDITQRDAELLSYLNHTADRDEVKEQRLDETECSSGFMNVNRDEFSDEDDDYILVSDRPIESRARASLPTNYLYLGVVNADTNEPSVFAKKAIPQRTKFGPFEGEIRFTSDVFLNILRSQNPRHYPLLLVGKSRVLIVTNENNSNWMRFVRLAQSYAEQNLQIIDEDGKLYFKCNRDIHPKEELRVGYHCTYANKHDLPILEPSIKDTQKKYESENPWMCFECDQRFPTSQEMQKHLEIHDVEDASCIISKRKIKRKKKKLKKLSELPKNSSRCLVCFKVFMTNASLKKHFATHLATRKPQTKIKDKTMSRSMRRPLYECQLCCRKFSSKEKLESHQPVHSSSGEKFLKCPHCDQYCSTPTALAAHIRSHTNRLYSCIYCQQTFKYVMEFKKHVSSHSSDNSYFCPHCKKKYNEYHLVRKHVRIFHPAVKYPCNECNRLFLHMTFLRRHKATHAKRVTLECQECGQDFKKKQELNDHVKIHHKVKRKIKKTTEKSPLKGNETQYIAPSQAKEDPPTDSDVIGTFSEDYRQYQFKCDACKVGFKRRGMLVNHIVKKHPDRDIDSIEELNQPIVKLQTVFSCPHCPKVYKNNAKRKIHILKNHPGMEVPPSFRSNPIFNDANVQTVGCVRTDVQKCQLCYKQYASRTRLLTHYRTAHSNERVPELPQAVSPCTQILIEEQCIEPVMDIYRPPVSPENKLLKLSSAALELSSIEDRKYFDFLNGRSETTDIGDSNRSNYKIVESEFGETSSNAELSRLPQLFDESIACI